MLEPDPKDSRDGIRHRDDPFRRDASKRILDFTLEVLVRGSENRDDLRLVRHDRAASLF
jgi:hypothetical protein